MATASKWRPEPEQLQQLAQYLADSLSGRDPNVRKNAEIMIKKAKASPDIDNYLCVLIANSSALNLPLTSDALHSARSAAGIMLKNNIKLGYKQIGADNKSFLLETILDGLHDQNSQVRNFVGNVVTELVRQADIQESGGLLPRLLDMISNSTGTTPEHAQEGASGALLKVCEDNRKALSKVYASQCPLDILVPRLLDFMSHTVPKIRANSISSINVFIPEKYPSVMRSLEPYLNRLFGMAEDPNDEVRKHICRSIVHIAEVSPTLIGPHMEALVDYMIKQQRSYDDPELALDAAEFFLFISEQKALRQSLGPQLHKIVPVLLESMVFSEDEVLRLEDEAEDAEQEDREQDIKPAFASSKASRSAGANGNLNGADEELSEGELEEYGEAEEDEDEDDPEGQWSLRKCSAAALDVLASVYPEQVFETTLPHLKDNLNHAEWANREAAVLALGAIAEGCMAAVEPHLPDLIPFLVGLLGDSQPVVRQITCWSLGRYSAWASHLDNYGKQQYFLPMMDGILKRMLDGNKRVQEAAVSAFANLEEKANVQLQDPQYCLVIVRQFAQCFAKYKDRNMYILYDCVQTLAEHSGPALQSRELVDTLMPPLIRRWEKVSDQSQEMFPLLECLSYVATSLGDAFAPYAVPIFRRCIKIIANNLQESFDAAQNPELAMAPDQDFLVTSLDLLSAIIQALGEERSLELVRESDPNMFVLLDYCLQNPNSDVMQSSYALLGDCAIYIYDALQVHLSKIMPLLMLQLNITDSEASRGTAPYAVVNNACWSCGEIAMRAGDAMLPYVETVLQRMYAILSSDRPLSLRENAAIAMGRLGHCAAPMLAPHISSFAGPLLHVMKGMTQTDEKTQAIHGLAKIAQVNPDGLKPFLIDFVNVVASLNSGATSPSQVQHRTFQEILTVYKGRLPDFGSMLQNLPPESQQRLLQSYTF